MHTKSSKNIVFWGGYGWGNVGDELTLAVAIAMLKEQIWGKISIITPNSGYTRALFPDLEIIPFQPAHRNEIFRRFIGKISGNLFGITHYCSVRSRGIADHDKEFFVKF